MKAADQSTCVGYWTERDRCGWTGRPLSQEGQTQTHRSTRQISRQTGLTQSSVIWITHRDVYLKCFFFIYQNACLLLLLVFSYTCISQGIVSVKTHLRFGGMYNINLYSPQHNTVESTDRVTVTNKREREREKKHAHKK